MKYVSEISLNLNNLNNLLSLNSDNFFTTQFFTQGIVFYIVFDK